MKVFYYNQDDINTDLMFPGKYTYESSDPEFVKKHLFEDLDPDFHQKVEPGDIILAGKNTVLWQPNSEPTASSEF